MHQSAKTRANEYVCPCHPIHRSSRRLGAKKEGSHWLPAVHRALRGFHFGRPIKLAEGLCKCLGTVFRLMSSTTFTTFARGHRIIINVQAFSLSCGRSWPRFTMTKVHLRLVVGEARKLHAPSETSLEKLISREVRGPVRRGKTFR